MKTALLILLFLLAAFSAACTAGAVLALRNPNHSTAQDAPAVVFFALVTAALVYSIWRTL